MQLLVEQDDARLNVCYDSIKQALRAVGRQILRLYRQFATDVRLLEGACFTGCDITCDDVILEADSDINLTPAERRNVVYELIDKGLLSDESGNVSRSVKNRVLEFIGYGAFASGRDLARMQAERADEENKKMCSEEAAVNEYDDHSVHISEHTAFLLSRKADKATEERVCAHIKIHKQKIKEEQNG